MQEIRTPAQEEAQDLFFGQIVIVWARWAVILAVTAVVFLTSQTVAQLGLNVLLVVALMAVNFYVHGRYLMELPANKWLVMATNLIDLLIVTGMVIWLAGESGLKSPFFVFYFPVVVAFAFVFPRQTSMRYTGLTMVVYLLTCLWINHSIWFSSADLKTLTMRLVVIGAVGGLATYYWRIQRDRRRAAAGISPHPEISETPGLAIS